MFRLSQFMRRLLHPSSDQQPKRSLHTHGPVVVWNLLRRCNLSCRHCYSASSDKRFQGELETDEIFRILAELKAFGVPALILSGGEPLLHPNLYEIAQRAKELGFYLGLSSNGTLMDRDNVARIKEVGFDYVGVSLDGLEVHHDQNRAQQGAFRQSLEGIRHCSQQDVKVGIRFTPTQENIFDLPALFELMVQEKMDRFYLSHWNYAGRGNTNRGEDAAHQATRNILEDLFHRAWTDLQQTSSSGLPSHRQREIVTGNNDADGPFFLLWVQKNLPEQSARARKLLARWGGNASGVGIANIDNRGLVHPDIFWWNHTLGNLRERSFAEIWKNAKDPILTGLRQKPRPVQGRCATCRYLSICGGNTRVRALQKTGNPWAEDPGCYLTDEEIKA